MSTIRNTLVGLLEQHVPSGWDVKAYLREPENITRPLVMLDYDTITPGPTGAQATAGVKVYVLIPSLDDAERNEDAVDDAMPFVTAVLFRLQSTTSVNATRATFAEKWPCWVIDVNLIFTITDDEETDPETEE